MCLTLAGILFLMQGPGTVSLHLGHCFVLSNWAMRPIILGSMAEMRACRKRGKLKDIPADKSGRKRKKSGSSAGGGDVRSLKREMKSLKNDLYKANELLELGRIIASEIQLTTLMSLITKVTSRLMDADRTSIFLLDRRKDELWSYVAQGMGSHQEIRFPASKGIAGHVAKTGETLNIPEAYEDERFNQNIDRQTGYRTRTILCMLMRNRNGIIVGVVQVINKRKGLFNAEDENFLQSLASMSGISLENAWLYLELEKLLNSFIDTSSMAIESRDPCTAGHSRRVAEYTLNLLKLVMADKEGPYRDHEFDGHVEQRMKYAALLHDFGKIGVREHILNKAARIPEDRMETLKAHFQIAAIKAGNDDDAGWIIESFKWLESVNAVGFMPDESIERIKKIASREYEDYFGQTCRLLEDEDVANLCVRKGNLNESEMIDMRSHAQKSFDMLQKIPWPAGLENVPVILHRHHEKLNGKGYPQELSGDEIDVESRILAIADIYDALTAQDRPYKPAIPHDRSADILLNMAKFNELDSYLVHLFLDGEGWKLD